METPIPRPNPVTGRILLPAPGDLAPALCRTALSYDARTIVPPATFVLGPDGTVRFAHVSRHPMDFADLDEVLAAVR